MRRQVLIFLKRIFIFLFLVLGLGMAGCGYTSRSLITNKFKTIYIKPFVNKVDITKETDIANKYRVYRPLLETDITRAVNNKFLFDGNLKPSEKETADLVLDAELIEFRREPLRYTDNDEVEEYRLSLVVNMKLLDRGENKLIWQESNFTGDATYFVRGQMAKSEDAAINDAINDLARRIVERTVEQW